MENATGAFQAMVVPKCWSLIWNDKGWALKRKSWGTSQWLWLVGGWFYMIFIFHFLYGIILPIDELIFFNMVGIPSTSHPCSMFYNLVGGLEHEFCLFHILGISSSQLTFTHIFQRGWLNHQPAQLLKHHSPCRLEAPWTTTVASCSAQKHPPSKQTIRHLPSGK